VIVSQLPLYRYPISVLFLKEAMHINLTPCSALVNRSEMWAWNYPVVGLPPAGRGRDVVIHCASAGRGRGVVIQETRCGYQVILIPP
jgi:hypothetical protein